MTFRRVVAAARGGPEVLQVSGEPLRPPSRKEVRVRVLAVPVGLPDVEARYTRMPFPPRVSLVSGTR
jgi:NADPH:quinone reductase-like Zn-dependent oxidoreductase